MSILLLQIARLVRLVAGIVVLLIVVAVVLRLLGANQANGVVHDVHQAAAWFVGPFKSMFSIHNPKWSMVVNWGLAALIYLIVGGLIAGLIARTALIGGTRSEAVA